MNAATAKKFLFKHDLPEDFDLWTKLAEGLVSCSNDLQVDGQYLERFEQFKKDINCIKTKFIDEAITPDKYAETVAALDADIDRMANFPGLPENVKELLKRYECSISRHRPSDIIENLRSQLEWLRDSVSKAQDDIDDAQDDIDGAQDDIKELEKKLDKAESLYNEFFNEEEGNNERA